MIWAAAYCRVSTDKEDQAGSFASQQRYFEAFISRQPDWALYRIYADEGVTGTSTKRRAAFNRMMADARAGRFSLLLTKEVSRFSRNILDTVAYTRELKQLGVGVLFLSDGIDTRDADAELRLSIMGSIAQEESRRTSARVKWGQTRRMEQGVVFGRSLLGYTVRDGVLTVEPEGAAVVRRIFRQYGEEKKSTGEIARGLEAAGCRTSRGGVSWSGSHIVKILRNEKYVGDLIQKKSITPDYLSHAKKYNHGEEEKIILRDHHEAIVSRALWETVQRELERRRRRGGAGGGAGAGYLFSGRLRCGQCGGALVPRQKRRKDGSLYRRWVCGRTVCGGKRACSIGWGLPEAAAWSMLRQAVESLVFDWDAAVQAAAGAVTAAMESGGAEDAESRREQAEKLRRKRLRALDAFLEGAITQAELRGLTEQYDGRLARLQAQPAAAAGLQEAAERLRAALRRESGRGDAFYRALLEGMEIRPDGTAALRLQGIPQEWIFAVKGSV